MNALTAAVVALPTIIFAGAASAQNAMVEIDDDQTMVQQMNMTVDQLDDMDVYDANDRKIGEIEDVLGTDRTTPSAVSVDFDETMNLGDDEDRIVPLSDLVMSVNRLVLSMNADAIRALPTYDD